MSDLDLDDVEIEEVEPGDSISQVPSFATNLSSHFPPSGKELPVPPGIKTIDRCLVVTAECLAKLKPHLNKVCFLQAIY
jgi:hypothetical protein